MNAGESGYSSFRQKVVYPSIRITILFLAVLAIGFASWFETNESVESCTFKNSLSFQQVYLYQNISSSLTTPTSVSIGLWKTCYFYTLNCTCSPTDLKYQPDIPTILQTATEHLATPPVATSSSLSRLAPLIVATLFAGSALFIGFIANHRKLYFLRRVICGFIIIATALTAYVFGSTFKSYRDSIRETCKDPNNSIYCIRYPVGIEVIIFGVGIGLLAFSFLFWFFAAGLLKLDDIQEEDEDEDMSCCGCFFKSKPEPETPTKKNHTSYEDQYQTPVDELAAWQGSGDYNYPEKTYYDQSYYPTMLQQQHQQRKPYTNHNYYSASRGHPSRVPSKSYDVHDSAQPRSKKHSKRSSSQPLNYYQQDTRNSSQNLDYYQQDARNSNIDYYQQNGKRSSSIDYYQQNGKRSSSIDYYQQNNGSRSSSQLLDRYNSPVYRHQQSSPTDYYQQTPVDYYQADYFQQNPAHYRSSNRKSLDSNLTFGGRNRSSGMDYSPRNGRITPTSMSPHPFLNNNSNENVKRSSYCMTPYYEDGSSGSNSSLHLDNKKKRLSQNPVPLLNMPPAGIEHPLNKKIIKDKRIQNYFQQNTSTNSSNST